jgi:hypothetical protein
MIPPAAIKMGKELLKTLWKAVTSKMAQKIAVDAAIEGGALLVAKGVEKLFSDKNMSFNQKLKQLKKLKKNGEITEEQYMKYRAKITEAQFS